MPNILKRFILLLIILMIIIALIALCNKIFEYYRDDSRFTETEAIVKSKYYIWIDAESSRLYLFKDNIIFKIYPCSGGKSSTPSPIGVWKIINKDTWGEGFGGRWLGLNTYWGRFGIHGTIFPNSIGSCSTHGCIRMYNNDVRELYNLIPLGTMVLVTDGCYGVFGKGFRTLKSGMYGADVLEIQKELKKQGFYRGSLNGRYDSSLLHAVYAYKKKNGLAINEYITKAMQEKLGFILME